MAGTGFVKDFFKIIECVSRSVISSDVVLLGTFVMRSQRAKMEAIGIGMADEEFRCAL